MKITDASAELLHYEDPIEFIESIGRLCTNSFNSTGEGTSLPFVSRLLEKDHTSVLEHVHVDIQLLPTYFSLPGGYDYVTVSSQLLDIINAVSAYSYTMYGSYLPIRRKADFVEERRLHEDTEYEARIATYSANLRTWLNFLRAIKSMRYNSSYRGRPELFGRIGKNIANVVRYALSHISDVFQYLVPSDDELESEMVDGWEEDLAHHLKFNQYDVHTVRINASKAITTEYLRQRVASFTQSSMRLTNFSEGISMVSLSDYATETNSEELERFQAELYALAADAEKLYLKYDGKLSPQIRRNALLVSTAAPMIMTANRRQWSYIACLRAAKGADPQIQAVMRQIIELLKLQA